MTGDKRTMVTMLLAGGNHPTVYGVFQTELAYTGTGWSWNLHEARHVGNVWVEQGTTRPSYRAMAEQYATAEYPAGPYPETT